MIRLLVYGMPGTPVIETSESLANFHDVDLFTLERHPDMESYWADKIPDFKLDTGDMKSGSESQQMGRDPLSSERDTDLDDENLDLVDSLSTDEICEILTIPYGIIVTEIPDPSLVSWASHVLFIDADENAAISWFKSRRKCPTCDTVFHLEEKPPLVPGICDRCGTDLKRKKEDHPIRVRKQYRNWRSEFNEMSNLAKKNKYYLRFHCENYENVQKMVDRVERWLKSSRKSKSSPEFNQI